VGFGRKLLMLWMKRRRLKLSPTQVIALVFLGIIALGTVLLMLPASSVGQPATFREALFTATSATCVTGLTVGDTGAMWTGFGQTVIIVMIEIGGLGFMSAAAMVIFLFKRKVGLRQRMVIAQALSLDDMENVVRIQKLVLTGSVTVQLSGAFILFIRFLTLGERLWTAVKWGLFHAVSAFCNAGFDIFGTNDSLMGYNSDPVILFTVMALVVIGGLGFLVWEELVRVRKFKKFSVYTKLVLITTGVLLLSGTVITALLEWNNPATLGSMNVGEKLLNALFQSVTWRTAGFYAIDQAVLYDATKAAGIVHMLIGGSSGSTAGGLKTVTFMVLILFLLARARGRSTVNVFKRSIAKEKVLDAMTIVGIVVSLCFAGSVFICATSPVSFIDSLYESASALATVGVTAGTTPLLSVPAQYMIILFMYFGRVGVLTLSLGFLMGDRAEERFRYAQTNILIG